MLTFTNLTLTREAEPGKTIQDVALDHDVPLNHSYGGNCACASCHVIVHEGMENLSEESDEEDFQLEEANGLTPPIRGSPVRARSGEGMPWWRSRLPETNLDLKGYLNDDCRPWTVDLRSTKPGIKDEGRS